MREYPAPGRTTHHTYLRLDRDGRCRLETPAFDEVYELRTDYLIALDRDSLDVERVIPHKLSGPQGAR